METISLDENNEDFSKCQCESAGFCSLFKKEMTFQPPNWQWCQNATEEERKGHFNAYYKGKKPRSRNNPEFMDHVEFNDAPLDKKNNYAVCVIPANEYALSLLEITRESIQRYAKKCKADYIELTGDQFEEFPMFNKYRVFQVASTYQKTLYLDCDVLIQDIAPDIFKQTPDNKISALNEKETLYTPSPNRHCYDWFNKHKKFRKYLLRHDSNYIEENNEIQLNLGVMVIPNSKAYMYSMPKRLAKNWLFDQDDFILRNNMDDVNYIDEKFNWMILRKDFWKDIANKYFIHVCSVSNNEYRKDLLHRLKNKVYDKLLMPAGAWSPEFEKTVSFSPVGQYITVAKDKAIFCIATGPFRQYIDVVKGNFKRYADKCGADLHFITNTTQRWWGLERFRLEEYCKKYKRMMLIEPDCVFKDGTPDLFDIVPEEKVGIFNDYSVIDHDHNWFTLLRSDLHRRLNIDDATTQKMIGNKTYYNGGVVVCSNAHSGMWAYPREEVEPIHVVDQFVVEYNIFYNGYDVLELDKKFNFQSWFPDFETQKKDAYIIHYSSSKNKLDQIKRDLKNDNTQKQGVVNCHMDTV